MYINHFYFVRLQSGFFPVQGFFFIILGFQKNSELLFNKSVSLSNSC